jgi:tetratricopeptide (TPR) repeat protein
VLALSRKVHGPEHPETLGAMTNLAGSYAMSGRIPEAIELQEKSLAIKRRVLPPNHPYLAVALNQMAALCEKTGRKEEALEMWEEALALSRKVNGPEHPDTLRIMSQLSKMRETRPEIVQNPLGFSLVDLVAKDEAGRKALLGEPDQTISGEDRDEETGVAYDEERSFTVKEYDLSVLSQAGKPRQITIYVGANAKLRGLPAVGAFLGDTVEFGEPGSAASFRQAIPKGSAPWRAYVEFDEDGLATSAKFVLPGEAPGE